jgi:hypothetical protein
LRNPADALELHLDPPNKQLNAGENAAYFGDIRR